MADRQPPTAEDEPEDVSDGRGDAVVRTPNDRAAEGPEAENCDAQRGDPKGDRDDEDEHDQRREGVANRHPQAGEDEPDDVEQQAHGLPASGGNRLKEEQALVPVELANPSDEMEAVPYVDRFRDLGAGEV